MDLRIAPVEDGDVDRLIALAHRIWQDTYPAIITQEQIDYMLAERYDSQRLRNELRLPHLWWEQALSGERLIGFSSSLIAAGGEMKLDKLYVDPQFQRCGVGKRLIEAVLARAATEGCATLVLAVNKQNERAIAAYRRLGFVVREAVCVAIGAGFVMDDFIMARSV